MNDIEITIEMFEPEVDVVNLASTPRKRVRDVGCAGIGLFVTCNLRACVFTE